ncbi:MAG TPA: hypothetical protein VGA22_00960 [Gemmatimonadales bacterium]|jgi:hypothetical protein
MVLWAAAGCGIGDLVSGDDGAATLALVPSETTLTNLGDELCFRWTARTARGDTLPRMEPDFSVTIDTAQAAVALSGGRGCVVAVKRSGNTPTEVVAVVDTVRAIARVRVHPVTP